MPVFDPFEIPEFIEAARRENEIRVLPFLGELETIGPVPVKPLTLRMATWLTLIKSPFLSHYPADVLCMRPFIVGETQMFLWIISPEFRAGNQRCQQKVFQRNAKLIKHLPAVEMVQSILDYVAESWLDSGMKGGNNERAFYSTQAAITGFFAKHYRLPPDAWNNHPLRNLWRRLSGQINPLDIPLKIAFQLIRYHQKFESPEMTFENALSDPVIANAFKLQNQE